MPGLSSFWHMLLGARCKGLPAVSIRPIDTICAVRFRLPVAHFAPIIPFIHRAACGEIRDKTNAHAKRRSPSE